ncbi:MAG TPA: phosphate/phosphite/phosphonate ABC transporter substrate-binding protein [Candidatus Methylomirabilis sp.]|nr:phosphate/phosphite/phosphonate ABC transporter substrate-binding protein [Candidatus Methylomirabilis sp.]
MKYIYLYILIFLLLSGCIEEPEKVNLSIVQDPGTILDDTAVKVAIASVVSPKESYEYYDGMIRYISVKLGGKVKIIQRRSYLEINELIKNNEIDFAFVCGGAYIHGNSEFGMKILVAPVVRGNKTYNSYIIVQNNSNYTSLIDLRGKKFAFSDPLSNSGKLYPTYRLYMLHETPESFFGIDEQGKNNSFYTYSHDNSIIAVAEQIAEGAAVDSLVYEHMKETRPDIISKTRIIEISPPFGIPPVVVSKDIDPFLEERLRDIFLNMNKDKEGKKILSMVKIDKFVNLNDSAYDSIREMRTQIQ